MPVGDQGQRPCSKGASSADGKGQEFCNDGKRGPAIDTGARCTRIIGYAKSVVIDVDDLVTSPGSLKRGNQAREGELRLLL